MKLLLKSTLISGIIFSPLNVFANTNGLTQQEIEAITTATESRLNTGILNDIQNAITDLKGEKGEKGDQGPAGVVTEESLSQHTSWFESLIFANAASKTQFVTLEGWVADLQANLDSLYGYIGQGWQIVADGLEYSGNASLGGSMRVGDDVSDCDTSKAGAIRFDGQTSQFLGCDGTSWLPFVQLFEKITTNTYVDGPSVMLHPSAQEQVFAQNVTKVKEGSLTDITLTYNLNFYLQSNSSVSRQIYFHTFINGNLANTRTVSFAQPGSIYDSVQHQFTISDLEPGDFEISIRIGTNVSDSSTFHLIPDYNGNVSTIEVREASK